MSEDDKPSPPKPAIKPSPSIKPAATYKPPGAAKPGPGSGKSEEEKWLASKITEIRSEIEKEIKVVFQSLDELQEVHSILMQQIIQRIEKKFGAGTVTQETYDLMDNQYYDIVYDNVEKLVTHIAKGTESVVQKIGDALSKGLDEILSSFRKS